MLGGDTAAGKKLREAEERKRFGNCWFKQRRHDRCCHVTKINVLPPYRRTSTCCCCLVPLLLSLLYALAPCDVTCRAAHCYKAGITLLSDYEHTATEAYCCAGFWVDVGPGASRRNQRENPRFLRWCKQKCSGKNAPKTSFADQLQNCLMDDVCELASKRA